MEKEACKYRIQYDNINWEIGRWQDDWKIEGGTNIGRGQIKE